MTHPPRAVRTVGLSVVLLLVVAAQAAVERFPPPEFESGHQLPPLTQPPAASPWHDVAYVLALIAALVLATWFALKLRSRNALVVLSVVSLAFFGFYMAGCVCPVGSVQNVTEALFNSSAAVPVAVVLIFALPVVFALLFGRVFCSSVCPLGAIQDLVLLRPLRLPLWLQYPLGLLPYAYLGLAVLFAATGSAYIICEYDPFVAFFRLDGPPHRLIAGGVLLGIATVVGRPYCRFLCPYGALLGMCARVARWRVGITPDDCINCRLCEKACPFGAIRTPTVEKGS